MAERAQFEFTYTCWMDSGEGTGTVMASNASLAIDKVISMYAGLTASVVKRVEVKSHLGGTTSRYLSSYTKVPIEPPAPPAPPIDLGAMEGMQFRIDALKWWEAAKAWPTT